MKTLIFSNWTIKEIIRDPISMFFGLVFPIFLLVLLTLINKNAPVNIFNIEMLTPGVAVLVPIIIGFILGNLDEDLRKFLNQGTVLLIPFFAFPLGAALDFRTILTAGGSGLLLGVLVTLLTGLGGYYVMALFGGKPRAVGAAIGTTAGNAVGTPAALLLADPSLEPYVATATAQIAAAVIVTAILCPLLVSYLDKRDKKKMARQQ